jgi:ribosomal protein S18 acetylase RimI-like enzyme
MGISVRLEPMTQHQFDVYRATAEASYAQSVAESGAMSADAARDKAVDDYARLLPHGLASADQHFFAAYDGDEEVGMLWLQIEEKPDGRHAFGYDFSVREELRRSGYGRAIMVAAEQECRARGVVSVGLNVFGPNVGAQALYTQMGYEVTSIQMRKRLC